MCSLRAHYICLLSTSKSHFIKLPACLMGESPVLPIMVLQCRNCGSYCCVAPSESEKASLKTGAYACLLGSPKGGCLFSFNYLLRKLGQVYAGLDWIIFECHNQDCIPKLMIRECPRREHVRDSIRIFFLEPASQTVWLSPGELSWVLLWVPQPIFWLFLQVNVEKFNGLIFVKLIAS